MDSEKDAVLAQLVAHLEQARSLRVAHAAGAVGERLRLREWQARRLANSYADLLESERFGPAAAFFLSDLYGPKDLSERDADIARLVPLLSKTMPLSGLQTVARAVELDALSERLDAEMAAELQRRGVASIDGAAYAAAYRKVGDRPGRERQIALIGEVGRTLDRLTRQPLVGGILRLMREPARLASMGAIQEFIERGFTAFQRMGTADEFLETIHRRETQLLEDLFAGRVPPCLLQRAQGTASARSGRVD